MTEWIEEGLDDTPSLEQLIVVCQAGPICMPAVCPVCGVVAAHMYFDKREHPVFGSRLGSVWIWCSACHRHTHGSIHAPIWWTNLEAVDRGTLDSTPSYLAGLSDAIDAHWRRLVRRHADGPDGEG